MRADDFMQTANPKIGREYQHIENLLIINGSKGGVDIVNELIEAIQNPQTLDLKCDGSASVYWGRDNDGTFVFVPKNQWQKGLFLSKEGLIYEILNSGNKHLLQTIEEFTFSRQELANMYEKLWDMFEQATPPGFRGYLTGDLMFTQPQSINETGFYQFTPNKVTYQVEPSGLGGKMTTAEAFVIVHGKLDQFGIPASGNIKHESDLVVERFNKKPNLIVLNTQTPKFKVTSLENRLLQIKESILQHAKDIDSLVNFTAPKFTTLRKVLYDYSIAFGKSTNSLDFPTWLESTKISNNQKLIIKELMAQPKWTVFWNTFYELLEIKNNMLDELYVQINEDLHNRLGFQTFINDEPCGEGLVKNLKNGMIGKLITSQFRRANPNPKFIQDS